MQAFQEADDPRVMLMTTSTAGKGITLNRASRVLITEVMPRELERQVIGRVDRLGQTRPMHVKRLVLDKTPELEILQMRQNTSDRGRHIGQRYSRWLRSASV